MKRASISKKLTGAFLLCAVVLCLGGANLCASARTRKQKKQPLPPLPSGPTGQKLQPVPLDAIRPVPPQVSFRSGQLTIVAPNSTLGDILRAVRKQTGAEIEIPEAQDRVVTHLGPGPAREVVAELLNGSRFNYVLLGSPEDSNLLTRVVLVAKSGPDNPAPNQPQQSSIMPAGNNMAPPPQEMAQDTNDADATDENANADENTDQQAAEEQPVQQDQNPNAPKTPQQMLQEMQQRQMQMQQQLAPGQPPIPGPGLPPGMPQRPPQEP